MRVCSMVWGTLVVAALAFVAACGGGGGSSADAAAEPDAPSGGADAAPGPADAAPDAADAAPDPIDAAPDPADAAPGLDAGPSCEVAPMCSGDLSGIGTGDFSITFTITSTATVGSAVICQRTVCSHSNFWDIRMLPDGRLSLELDDSNQAYFSTVIQTDVNDGLPHAVAVCRKAGTVYAFVDGALALEMPAATNLAAGMNALQTGTSACVGFDGTAALSGMVTDVCVGGL